MMEHMLEIEEVYMLRPDSQLLTGFETGRPISKPVTKRPASQPLTRFETFFYLYQCVVML